MWGRCEGMPVWAEQEIYTNAFQHCLTSGRPTHWGASGFDAITLVAGDGGAVGESVVGAPVTVGLQAAVILRPVVEQLGAPEEGVKAMT